MKSLLLIPILAIPLLMTGCETTVVDRHPHHRGAYVERDVVVDRRDHRDGYGYDRDVVVDRRRGGYVERDVVVTTPRARRDVVVVEPRSSYRPQVEVRYYSDSRGRYYIKNGRRIYVNAGVHY